MRKGRTRDHNGFCTVYVVLADLRRLKHEIGHAVPVHQNTALGRAFDFGKGQTDFFAVFGPEDVRGVDTVLLEVVDNVIAVLVIGNLSDKADLFAESCKTDGNIRR